ncbi:hypothetical protein BAE46_00980 [Glaciecola punicea]|uniref:hypothetical protein n=1 Tax=Glaciecola punicea TaxID=56804 RepID=UPI0008724AFB|nr:hypothetical protein [Glaciecola punicea]OFA33316.1 hypothetical protein BAE46_00980 [Glaciecola punicea]
MKITTEETPANFTPIQINITLESQQELDLLYAISNNGSVYGNLSLHQSLPNDCVTQNLSHSYITRLFENFTTKIFKAIEHYVI